MTDRQAASQETSENRAEPLWYLLPIATLFLPWYGLSIGAEDPSGFKETFTAWESFATVDVLIVVASVLGALAMLVTPKANMRVPRRGATALVAAASGVCLVAFVALVYRMVEPPADDYLLPGTGITGVDVTREWGLWAGVVIGGFFFLMVSVMGPLMVLERRMKLSGAWESEDRDLHRKKRCPDCAEEVLQAARRCKHCGHEFRGVSH